MKPYVFHPEAEQEYSEAARYYARINSELGGRFYDEIERMILQEEEFQEQEEEFQECFGWVDARYAELLEAKLAFYENQNQYENCV